MRRRKSLGVLASVLGVFLAVTGVTGTADAHADSGKRVFNGMQIYFPPNSSNEFCTIGAVGHDKYGRKIAISAGHCLTDPSHQYSDREIPENVQPVYDRNDAGFGPIGYVRYFKDPEGSTVGHPTKDYMIIELVPAVTLSSQGPYLKETGELEVPGGQPSPNALTPPLDNERLLGAALDNDNELVVSGQLGVLYGRITNNSNGVYQSWAGHQAGDSGGPAIWHVPGSAYPSSANGFQAAGPWAGITKARVLGIPPYVYTSSANILADLRARDTAHPGIYGAGFQVTDNP
ncbi:chymotrypsin family serine protease [Streptantibioticus cattleyicolor]|uniref:Serine protease n=1 Tax=Streptantibioticus cattleyicolor (strain ATCC 35852 / DSM 46488 / JCM 4925 / NBRC 14057 / NRRL 8057) TaxID=1003195 RepID=F8JKF3_STREN|nr:hypothetical protein [Streptantibioticus cattleyicolor]AEW99779.1 hypothetical protein SCATT_p15860 [Streptantibioticus cattleyicolor NRRL 8057 = DSM 46488]CCB71182.1 conserved exported protein of unknown function [Streptantibioticus cattleyicolor NRRL 8057 = DSM 46488]